MNDEEKIFTLKMQISILKRQLAISRRMCELYEERLNEIQGRSRTSDIVLEDDELMHLCQGSE